jgi:predicted GNAT family acetyltransferase
MCESPKRRRIETMIEFSDTGQRYELSLDGVVVGHCLYRDLGPRRIFLHTEVDAEHAGQGLATRLIEFALADCTARDRRIVARCPMVAAYLGKHPELDEFVDSPAGVDGVSGH